MKAVTILIAVLSLTACEPQTPQGTSARTGNTRQVKEVSSHETDIITGSDGLTTEQRNIKHRIEIDNKPGAMKHMYIINAQGKCIFYDAVAGKVTSSQKRLYKHEKVEGFGGLERVAYVGVENLGYDGTYGSSSEYIYWWNVNGAYRQLQVGSMCSVLITEIPVRFSEVEMDLSIIPPNTINVSTPQKTEEKK